MKNPIPYLFATAALLYLIILLFLQLRTMNHEPQTMNQKQRTQNPEPLRVLAAQSDSQKLALAHLYTHQHRIQAQLGTLSQESAKKIEAIKALPTDQQGQYFNTQTGGTDSLTLHITPSDTLVEVPLPQLREANLQFAVLDTLTAHAQLLQDLVTTQDSLLFTHEARQVTLETQTALLSQQNDLLQETLQQKDRTLKKQKRKHTIQLIGAAVLVVLMSVL